MRTWLVTTIIFMLIIVPGPILATSLFDEEGCDLITTDRAGEIGDLVTIVIAESTSASNRASTETAKKLNTDGELTVKGFLQWITSLPAEISPLEDINFTPSEDFEGEGKVSTTGAFQTRLTAMVKEVLPNGNLIIEGERAITISKDSAILTIIGVIDPDDITNDNTVSSTQIAELEILYEGEGIIADRQHDGILSRIFNFFF